MIIRLNIIIFLLIILILFLVFGAERAGIGVNSYRYSAKFVCGTMPHSSTTQSTLSMFEGAVNPGIYTTAINIHNPQTDSLNVVKTAVLSPREPDFGSSTAPVLVKLPPLTATEADCPDIYSLLGMGTTTDFIKGFLVVESTNSIDVVPVYTSQGLDENEEPVGMSAVDIEYNIPERRD